MEKNLNCDSCKNQVEEELNRCLCGEFLCNSCFSPCSNNSKHNSPRCDNVNTCDYGLCDSCYNDKNYIRCKKCNAMLCLSCDFNSRKHCC